MTVGAAVAERIAEVRDRIARAASRSGRDPATITLVAVSKGVGAAAIAEAASAGVRDVGENRVQELLAKQAAVDDRLVRWHLIGTLQRNKVRSVVGRVALIHSVDSLELAAEIGNRARAAASEQELLVQVNTSGEPTKHGVSPARAASLAREIAAVAGARLRGLMTIAAPNDPGAARASFAMLRHLRDGIVRDVPTATELSMGMTDDLEEAVAEGATILRVGRAIFGERGG